MQITIFSFFSSALGSSVLIIGIYALRKVRRFRTSFGLSTLVMLYLFSIIRSLFPLELPHVIELGIDEVYPEVYRFLTNSHSYGERLNFSYVDAFVCIWIAGIIILMFRYIVYYHKEMRGITKYAPPCGRREYTALNAVKRDIGKSVEISLCTFPNISVPFGIGVFRKTILLPQNNFTDRELYYILLHEYTHFLNHDIAVKMMVSLFCCIFWWNPVAYLLKADLEQTLEMKCDASVARYLDRHGKAAYLRTIVGVIKHNPAKRPMPYTSTALFQTDRMPGIKERFDVVMNYEARHDRTLSQIALFLIGACVFVLSYAVLPQPKFDTPSSEKSGVIEFDSDTAYIQQNKAQEYWLYIQDELPIKLTKDEAEFYQQTGITITKE